MLPSPRARPRGPGRSTAPPTGRSGRHRPRARWGRLPEVGWLQRQAPSAASSRSLLAALTAPRAVGPPSAGTAAWGRTLLDAPVGLVLGRSGGRPPEVGHAVERSRKGRGPTEPEAGPLLRYDGPGHVLPSPTRAGKGRSRRPEPPRPPRAGRRDRRGKPRHGATGPASSVIGSSRWTRSGSPLGTCSATSGEDASSAGGNPLDLAGYGSADAADDAAFLAEMIVVEDASSAGQNRFWSDEAKALLTGLALYVALDYDGPGRSLLTVREILTSDARAFKALVGTMMGHDDPVVRRTGNRMDRKHDRERSAVVSTAQSHTHFLDSPRMEAVLPEHVRPGRPPPGPPRLSGHVWGRGPAARLGGRGEPPHRPARLPPPSPPDRLALAPALGRDDSLGPRAPRPSQAGHRPRAVPLGRAAQLGPMPPVRRARSPGRVRAPGLAALRTSASSAAPATGSRFRQPDVVRRSGRRTVHGRVPRRWLGRQVFHQSQPSQRDSRGRRGRGDGDGPSARDARRRLGRDAKSSSRGEDPVPARRIAYYDDQRSRRLRWRGRVTA